MAFTPANAARALGLITTSADAGTPTPASAIMLTPQTTAIADTLIQDNQAFAALLTEQAKSRTLAELQSFNAKATADSEAAQTEMKLLSSTLAQPITAAEEP